MKKILGLSVAALMVMGLVGGGTWAYFSDTETVSDNMFAAGTLDLGLSTTAGQNPTQSITGTFDASNWAPGDTKTATIYVNNEGTIAMSSVNLTWTISDVTDGTPATVDAGPGGDTDNFTKMVKLTTVTWNGTSVANLVNQTLDSISLSDLNENLGALPANTEVPFVLTFTFDSAATNGCQGDSVNMTLTFTGKQQ